MAGGWELRNPWQGVSDGVMDVYFQKSGDVKSPLILGCHNHLGDMILFQIILESGRHCRSL